MTVGLFVPCFVEQFYPHVAIAAIDLLEQHGCKVTVPSAQTCCGQPLANAGFESETSSVAQKFVQIFQDYEYVVAPSASCALHVRDHYGHLDVMGDAITAVRAKTYELTQFLWEILGVRGVQATYRRKVALHAGCHGLRGLRLGHGSELMDSKDDIVRTFLESVDGLQIVEPARIDECCGFGGTFSVSEEAVSVKMGRDRLHDFLKSGAEVIASTDMSCLMHLQGLSRRAKKKVEFVHVAEILSGSAV